jgi:Zn-dependent peptidase ImmA (M78 family)
LAPALAERGVSTVKSEAAREAAHLLTTIWAEEIGSVKVPVDPARIARRLGIDVFEAELPAGTSGAIVKQVGRDPVILLNNEDSPNRQRFTCAHELGHFVSRSGLDDNASEYEYVDMRDHLASAGKDPDEIYANEFAASLLMPTDHVRRDARSLSPLEMAVRYDVSAEAMTWRLKNLRLRR